jgi:hypothetical protein
MTRPIRILNNTQAMLDVRYAGKLVRARLSPQDSFDLYPGTWGNPDTFTVAVVGFDSGGRFVGTATRDFRYDQNQGRVAEAVTKSLERQGFTGGRKEITIEDINPVKIAGKVGSAAKALNPTNVSQELDRLGPLETWAVERLLGPRP